MLGFSGKFAIHPDQVQILKRGFRPSESDIECVEGMRFTAISALILFFFLNRWAARVVAAMEAAEAGGRASASLDGIMIDTPVYERCKQLLLSEQELK
jgi:citrate lyase beta subunit